MRARPPAVLALLVLALCCSRRTPTSASGDPGSPSGDGLAPAGDAGASSAADLGELASTDDPYARWALGLPGGAEELPAPLPALVDAAGEPEHPVPPKVSWLRGRGGWGGEWQATVAPREGTVCDDLERDLRAVLGEAGYAEAEAVRDDRFTYERQRHGVDRTVRLTCEDAREVTAPGCAGGSCFRPARATVTLEMILEVPAFTAFEPAMAPLPAIRERLLATTAPGFLVERLGTARLDRIYCEFWSADGCGELSFWVEPPGDAKAWILETIDLAERRGFRCDERYKDPARDWIGSTQECSGSNLWYKLDDDGLVRVRVAAILGAEAQGTPVSCSRQETPAAADDGDGPRKLLDMPVTDRCVAHLEKVRDCYARHQRAAGREADVREWRRLGDYLRSTIVVADADFGGEVGTRHGAHEEGAADGFHARFRAALAGGGQVELYVEQDDLAEPWGRAVLDVTEERGTNRLSFQVALGDAAAELGDAAAIERHAREAVDEAAAREIRGAEQVQECRVLPNMGQECSRRAATEEERAAEARRVEERRAAGAAWIDENATALATAVGALYPFADEACTLAVPASSP